jgi:hypothetical protein
MLFGRELAHGSIHCGGRRAAVETAAEAEATKAAAYATERTTALQ